MPTTTGNQPPDFDNDLVPGTVYLVGHSPGSEGHPRTDVLLVPAPSQDPADPLRWSIWRKRYHLSVLLLYSTLMTALGNWESPVYADIGEVLNTSISQLNIGTALSLLMLGVGNVFLTPLSEKFGRRFVYVLSLIMVVGSQIWLATAKDAGDFIGSHVLFGIGRAPYEALVPVSFADIFFTHERGFALGVYGFGLAAGSSIGPICSGHIIGSMGWRWVYWWGAILCAAIMLIILFTLEESKFIRDVPHPSTRDNLHGAVCDDEKAESDVLKSLPQDNQMEKDALKRVSSTTTACRVGEVFETNKLRPQYRPWAVFPGTFKGVFKQCYQPLQLAWFPAVLWSGIEYGASVSWIAVLGTTTAVILGAPPYNMSDEALGLIWLSPLVGGFFGACYAGPLNDRVVLFLCRRNRGWLEPEFRLWAFFPTAFLMSGGLVLYGIGAAHGIHWIGPVIGMGLVSFGLTVAAVLTMAYVVDCYQEVDGQAVTTVILIRNIIGFAMVYGIQPWIDKMGIQDTFIMVCFLSFGITLSAGVFIVWGKQFRRMTKRAYHHFAVVAR